jgi:hypothetical protein
MRHWGESES